ncbi:PAS domain S-box protein [Desulfovibrio ferrophilus]|uniref:histidine kinase n=1 Tax=Desulfovibrio ferrophilus TaxID=241368 RepID=A0A2Z6B1R5_9BACT|nr:PAS domain S-box protein [Desulfovibrio ferrophilus]BBD09415.1 PAS/PAC sensor hybrid histidine kinase [Desulfovibrio ferrophilus]
MAIDSKDNDVSALLAKIEDLQERLEDAEAQAAVASASGMSPDEAARKFRFIADSSRDFMTLINADYEYEAANAAYLEAAGFSVEQLVGRSVAEVWGGAAIFEETIKPCLDKAFAGEHTGYETWFDFHARGRGYFSVTYSPYVSDSGEITHVAVISHDMTQWKLTKDALQLQERRFKSIVDTIPDLIYRLDNEGRVTFVNKAIVNYGYTPEEVVGRHILELVHPEDRKQAMHRVDERRTGDRRTSSLELRLMTKAGTLVDMELRTDRLQPEPILLFDAEGVYEGVTPVPEAFAGTQGMARDVTEARRAEQLHRERETLYRVMFENTGTGMASIGSDGTIIKINSKFKEICGWTNETVAGTNFLQYVAPEHRTFAGTNHQRRQMGEDVPSEYELDLLSKDGQVIHAFVQVGLLPESGQTIVSVVDITQRVRTEEELRRARDVAEQANRIKNEFLANMSHEVRTPLNGILGMAELVMLGELDEDQLESIEMIRESGRNLLAILNDLLDISKIEAGRLETEKREFSLSDVLRQVQTHFGTQAARQGLEFDIQRDPDAPDALLGDDVRIRQVLFNLVGNSLKFTDEGSIIVRVDRLDTSASDGALRLLFCVEDTGIGISDEFQHVVFEPFTQADGSFTRKYQGTGLGLGIVKRLVTLMEGSVTVDSAEGQGTSVYFSLPVTPAREEPMVPQGQLMINDLPRLRVLVAEDNTVNRIYAERVLAEMGHTVSSVSNGREAVQALSQERFDLVFMDISMPEMDGLEATQLIRESSNGILDPKVPIVAMTAHAMKGDRERFMQAGMDGYVAKPMERDDLVMTILRVLSRSVMGVSG